MAGFGLVSEGLVSKSKSYGFGAGDFHQTFGIFTAISTNLAATGASHITLAEIYNAITLIVKVNHIHSYFKFDNINYLGYYSCNVFKAISTNTSFTEILKCELLSEKFNKGIGESIKLSSIDFGPFDTKALSESDFMKTDFKGLKDALEKYWAEDTWGVDLPVFKQNFQEVEVILRTQDLLKGEFYSINLETAREVLTPDPNFWTYFFGFVCIENESQTIMTAYFGLD